MCCTSPLATVFSSADGPSAKLEYKHETSADAELTAMESLEFFDVLGGLSVDLREILAERLGQL